MIELRLAELLGRCPEVYALSPEALGATLEAVAELTGLQPHQVPQLVAADPALLLQPDRLKDNMRGLAEALCVEPRQLPGVVSREPGLLALSGPQLEQRLEALEELLLGALEAAFEAAMAAPGPGTRRQRQAPDAASRTLPAAAAAVVAAMLVAAPRLLGQNVGALVAKWQLLAALCSKAAAPTWAARLAAATVPERAELLDLPFTHLARLRYLSDFGLQGEVDPLEAVRASDELFQLQYPNFKQWLRG
ncbi:hypothetical protein GPECTOR_6g533 [Gonium pectorale]|uniref:Uncharacterized protein n=1 Tax=Gonium pectorale TaxID=33097 RepID=A0A150GUR7_GONPE|nr:hypothetical protein GPECTOR_6g533 [Gonium pectorale]|eukprot:KXZ53616.1 hypothetical protein GPECTOR_6g533 [Gonium pectorale]